jgi:hypothetical protein
VASHHTPKACRSALFAGETNEPETAQAKTRLNTVHSSIQVAGLRPDAVIKRRNHKESQEDNVIVS